MFLPEVTLETPESYINTSVDFRMSKTGDANPLEHVIVCPFNDTCKKIYT